MAGALNKLNIVDKVVGYISPSSGLRRMGLRLSYNAAIKRSFEAATKGRRGKSFKAADNNGPNVTVGMALSTLRARSRHLINNNGWAKRAQGVICSNVIGEGIRPAPAGTKNQAKRLKSFWKEWAESTDCDWYGKMTFYGLQELIMREIVEAGDCLIIRRRVSKRIPIQLQVLQGDQLDHSVNSVNDKGFARLGVQYNSEGKITGYWVWSQHPSDMAVSLKLESEFIPAEDVIHPFEVLRAGQSRGLPMGVAGFMKLSDFSDYEDAQLMRQKVAAAFAAFITNTGETPQELEDPFDHIEPGIIQRLHSEEQITFSSPPPASNYDEYSRKILQGIASAYEITYEQLTMDYSNVNFTSGRMAKIDASGRVRKLQYNMIVPQVCVPVWNWFMNALIVSGLQSVYIPCGATDWTAPRVQQLDPVKETNARIMQLKAGLTTWSEVVREDGRDPVEFIEEYKADKEMIEEAGITFDSIITDTNYNDEENNNIKKNK